jgi:hypothetical protein
MLLRKVARRATSSTEASNLKGLGPGRGPEPPPPSLMTEPASDDSLSAPRWRSQDAESGASGWPREPRPVARPTVAHAARLPAWLCWQTSMLMRARQEAAAAHSESGAAAAGCRQPSSRPLAGWRCQCHSGCQWTLAAPASAQTAGDDSAKMTLAADSDRGSPPGRMEVLAAISPAHWHCQRLEPPSSQWRHQAAQTLVS